MSTKAYVGLSGGVDSAVSAALLKKQGFDVTGVFIKIWQPEFFECTWEKDRLDAMRVAVSLGIAFKEIDLSEQYLNDVVRDMIDSYSSGYTPNPDIACNEKVKFGHFYDWAMQDGADVVATGHYARIGIKNGSHVLMRGADTEKDQSYFLYRIPRANLARIRFPVGELRKSDVRSIAARLDLPVARKSDSQGLCFVGDIDMRTFLKRYISVEPGDVLDTKGSVIGRHHGAALYTIGQRHGFETRISKQYFVQNINTIANTITVVEDKRLCMSSSATISDLHWLSDVSLPMSVGVQSRYREPVFKADASAVTNTVQARFSEPHIVSPGQSLVAYDGDVCLGGGKIEACA